MSDAWNMECVKSQHFASNAIVHNDSILGFTVYSQTQVQDLGIPYWISGADSPITLPFPFLFQM